MFQALGSQCSCEPSEYRRTSATEVGRVLFVSSSERSFVFAGGGVTGQHQHREPTIASSGEGDSKGAFILTKHPLPFTTPSCVTHVVMEGGVRAAGDFQVAGRAHPRFLPWPPEMLHFERCKPIITARCCLPAAHCVKHAMCRWSSPPPHHVQ